MDENDDYDDQEEEANLEQGDGSEDGSITAIPALTHYQKRYALSLADNDQKAVRLFKEYESMEMIRRLQSELMWVSGGQVYSQTLDAILGKKRRSKYKTYSEWGRLMLIWLAEAKR